MSINRDRDYLISLINELIKYPNETEWVEFKHNNKEPKMIGEYISALANSASLHGKINAYMVWGIDDITHDIIGTDFKPSLTKKGNEEIENWLLRLLEPKIDFRFYELEIENKNIVVLEIDPAFRHPVRFSGTSYIRIGSYKKILKEYPQKERELWRVFDKTPFEKLIAVDNIEASEVLDYLEFVKYFELLKRPLPNGIEAIIEALEQDELIHKTQNGKYAISNLGAILFAKDLNKFHNLKRKSIRVIQYSDSTKLATLKEKVISKGYAIGFEEIIEYINAILPSNEIIEQAFRESKPMYPELAIRELVANSIIHQDFFETGTSVMIEIFSNRIEFTNPGVPLVDTDRFLDTPPKSRNEALASFLRRINICEERGSGIDKVVIQTEIYQLPAPIFEVTGEFTRSILFAYKALREMDKSDKIRACYLHAGLRYIQRDYMTNSSLRERFKIEVKNRTMVSKIIKDTLDVHKILIYDKNVGAKARSYIPWWVR